MKKIGMSILVAASLVSTAAMAGGDIIPDVVVPAEKSMTGWKSKHVFFGFSQIGLAAGDGAGLGDDANMRFELDRIRLGWKYFSGPLAGKVFLDFGQDASKNGGKIEVPDVIKDAFISYKFDDAAVLKAGVIKTPVGQGFTIPGWNLDVIKRGFDKKLAFERAAGLMLSGRDIGFGNNGKVDGLEMGHERPWKGFGYDVMITGSTARSGAVSTPDSMKKIGNGFMGRLMFDWGEQLHLEASYGAMPNADGVTDGTGSTDDYKVLNLALDSHLGRTNIKGEYYDVENIRGEAGWDMSTFATTATYYLTDTFELAIKDIRGTENKGGGENDASNTYLGFNYYINPKNNNMDRKSKRGRNRHKVVVNYVMTDVDDGFKGVGALYKEDAVLAQYQFKF